jgi:hypothetical protein
VSTEMPWQELVDYSETHDLLAKRLYVVFSEPTDGLGPVMDALDLDVAHQTRLEMDGTMSARWRRPAATRNATRCTRRAPAPSGSARGSSTRGPSDCRCSSQAGSRRCSDGSSTFSQASPSARWSSSLRRWRKNSRTPARCVCRASCSFVAPASVSSA